jgi:CheY-like chemotaxis protein
MILFVDDEPSYVANYVTELQVSGYRVDLVANVTDGLRKLESKNVSIELMVLDIMMSPRGAFTAEETQQGLRTGVRVYETARRERPQLPIIILTNAKDGTLAARFRGDPYCRYVQKLDCLPFQLIEKVKTLLREVRELNRGNQ